MAFMARLGNLELKALSQALLDLYLPGTYSEFPARVVALARRLFSCDNYCICREQGLAIRARAGIWRWTCTFSNTASTPQRRFILEM
jgi:hypothetical protein